MTTESYPTTESRRDTELMMRYDANKKSALLAYVIWFFLPACGVHRIYLGRWGSGLAMLALHGISWLLTPVGVGFIGLGVVYLWWLIDAVLIPGIARAHNNRLIERLRA